MTREEAYEILKAGICLICAYGCKNMDDCDISHCEFRDAVKTLIEESCEDAISRYSVPHKIAEFFSNWDGDENAKMEISVNDMREIAFVYSKKARIERQLTEIKPIGYRECSDAMLKMWMDNVLTDGEYYRIMDKLNAKWSKMNEVTE